MELALDHQFCSVPVPSKHRTGGHDMENQSNSRTTKSDIGGTVYVVESRVSDSAKESAYSKLKRLITVNAKSLSKLSDSSYKPTEINSTSSR